MGKRVIPVGILVLRAFTLLFPSFQHYLRTHHDAIGAPF
jgi:hypothetical protein